MKKTMTVHLHSPKRINIELPTTKIKLSEILEDEVFEHSEDYIQFGIIHGYEGLNFRKGLNLNDYNLLAEKLNNLDQSKRELLYSILDCKFSYIDKNYNISTKNICSLIDNLHNFKLHNNKTGLNFDDMMKVSTDECTIVALEYIGTEKSYVNNYAKYDTYEMPYHDDYIKLILSNGKDNIEKVLMFPLEKNDLEWVENMDCDLSFEIKRMDSNISLFAKFKVDKEDLLKLNDFAITYFDSFEITQRKFDALYEYYDEFLTQKENGLPFDTYFEILDEIKNYHICNYENFTKEIVNRYCELNNISKGTKSFIDKDLMFEDIFEVEPLYTTNKNMCVYNKDDLDNLFKEKNLINNKNESEEQQSEQEQEYEGMEM